MKATLDSQRHSSPRSGIASMVSWRRSSGAIGGHLRNIGSLLSAGMRTLCEETDLGRSTAGGSVTLRGDGSFVAADGAAAGEAAGVDVATAGAAAAGVAAAGAAVFGIATAVGAAAAVYGAHTVPIQTILDLDLP